MELEKRKQNRLSDYNYSNDGYYFITICTSGKLKVLCNIVGGGAFDAPKIILSEKGRIAEKYIESSSNIPAISICKYVIMPNHIHIVIKVDNTGANGTSWAPSPTNKTVPHFVSTLKRFINKECGKNIFQRSFYDHVIRDEDDYLRICEYIENNPAKWSEDKYYIE